MESWDIIHFIAKEIDLWKEDPLKSIVFFCCWFLGFSLVNCVPLYRAFSFWTSVFQVVPYIKESCWTLYNSKKWRASCIFSLPQEMLHLVLIQFSWVILNIIIIYYAMHFNRIRLCDKEKKTFPTRADTPMGHNNMWRTL